MVRKKTLLHAEFDDAQRAAWYLASGISQAYPDAPVQVVIFSGLMAPPRTMRTETNHLEPVLERATRRFPNHRFEVLYDPDRKQGVVGLVRCACDHLCLDTDTERMRQRRSKGAQICPKACKTNADKPQAVVRLIPIGSRESNQVDDVTTAPKDFVQKADV